MLFQSIIASTLLASAAYAQSSQVQVQVVSVSNAGGSLAYFPDQVTAAPGSIVQFQFHPKNHTVTQSSFSEPCTPITVSNTSVTQMVKSGFMPVEAAATEIPVFSVVVNDTAPVWIYCGQTGHCGKGMVMAINANNNSTKNFAAFRANALATANSTSSSSSSGSGTTSSSGSASSASGTTSSGPAQQTTNSASKPVVGFAGLAMLAVAGFAFLL